MKKWVACLLTAGMILSAVTVYGEEVIESPDSPTGYEVVFTYEDADASRVRLYGEWAYVDPDDNSVVIPNEEWVPGLLNSGGSYYELEKGEDGIWSVSVPLPNGLYGYRFYIDGEGERNDISDAKITWDPANKPQNMDEEMQEGQGGDYYLSTVYVPFDAEKQTEDFTVQAPREDEYKGTVEFFKLSNDTVGEQNLTLYLPYNFDPEREEPYKLLVLFHGGGGFYANWVNNGAADNIADNLIAEGKFDDDTLILMPDGTAMGFNPDSVAEFLLGTVQPYLYENYNVSEDPQDHAFSGLSAGSGLTSGILIHYTDNYKYYYNMSGARRGCGIEDGDYEFLKDKDVVIRMTAGPTDIALDDVVGVLEILDSYGIPNTSAFDGTGHCWFTWRINLADYLENYLWK